MNILNLLNSNQQEKIKYINASKDEIVFFEDQLCDSVYFVIEGEIKISSYFENGKEIIYSIIKKDGMFANNLIFSSKPSFKGNVTCLADSKIAYINKNDLLDIFRQNKSFLEKYLNNISNSFINLNQQIKILNIDNALDRLIYYLSVNNNKIIIKNISSLAKTLFLTRESTSRIIHKLINENRIIFKNSIIILK